jgi:hypothetical protein
MEMQNNPKLNILTLCLLAVLFLLFMRVAVFVVFIGLVVLILSECLRDRPEDEDKGKK